MASRPKSAAARLTPPVPLTIDYALTEPPKPKHGQGDKDVKKRVHSARGNKMKNEDSKKVFPRSIKDTGLAVKERYRSQYNKDFEGSYISPVEPRPTSPTRRNNPHPSQVRACYNLRIDTARSIDNNVAVNLFFLDFF